MENLGALALLLAFCICLYAIVASVVGRVKHKPFLTLSGERAVLAVWFLISSAAGILIYSLLTGDMRMAYVASHTNRAMPLFYKFSAWWGGQEGSLLFWSWILSTYGAVVVLTGRGKHRVLMPWVVAILSSVQIFFLTLNAFVVSPFQVLALDKVVTSVPDGMGLNPLLQYWAMVIHPPMLYLGYVGFAVPFAFAMASLISKAPGDSWIHTTRRWTIVTWLFQGTGIMLGSAWAYHVLGWGGYWMWDPVENASLLPWLAATAFLHSVMMQEKKGMMKVWNMVLIGATFFLCIYGTFLTRSGIISSVHAFAESPIGKYFVGFLAIGIAATLWLILDRLDYLKSEAELESVVSRESSFLFNNLILLASCFAVLWGTMFPVLSEKFSTEKISLDAVWFNRLMVPIGLFLLFLTGVGPLFAWRRTSMESLRKNFQWPGVGMLVVVAALYAGGMRYPYSIISLGLCFFVAATIVMEFFRGSNAINEKTKVGIIPSMIELTHRNTRRYGGYLVHMGIVLMFIGWSGHPFNQTAVGEVNKGDTLKVGAYTLKVMDLTQGETSDYQWDTAILDVSKNGKQVGTLEPTRRFYKIAQQGTAEVALRTRLNEDLYINYAARVGDKATLQAYVFPLVTWIWVGVVVLIFGTFVCLVPSKVARSYPRTEVVGIAKTNVPVKA
ncbi:MAG TPA: heme lyase CcmF/NrfE family subunit [Bryobacteraceae bacterium]|nr:heme lyase CcmF/NrfE family subunit [Bryobacteraceae bacterium]